MANSLLFIPDISGFTNFVQTTEVEHSQHVIAELLEVLILANTQNLKLAEIEGDALFFYKENELLSQEELLAQVEKMYTAFYSHLQRLEKNRICPCKACSTAINLELKIIIHSGSLRFLQVRNNRKPFGEEVIQVHRLLKNSIKSDNYVLISKDLAKILEMPLDYKSSLFSFKESNDSYDGKSIDYLFSIVEPERLNLKAFQEEQSLSFNKKPDVVLHKTYPVSAEELIETITNYRYRHRWAKGAKEIVFKEKEVTRLGSEHVCVIGNRQLGFKVVTKKNEAGKLIYGEKAINPPPADAIYQFFDIKPLSKESSHLKLEIYFEAKSLFKRLMIFLFVKKLLRKNMVNSLDNLATLLAEQTNDAN